MNTEQIEIPIHSNEYTEITNDLSSLSGNMRDANGDLSVLFNRIRTNLVIMEVKRQYLFNMINSNKENNNE
jgi:hypothetical protein